MFTSLVALSIISQECLILQRIPRSILCVVGLTLATRENDSFYNAKQVESLSIGNDDSSQSKLDLKEKDTFLSFILSSIFKFFTII